MGCESNGGGNQSQVDLLLTESWVSLSSVDFTGCRGGEEQSKSRQKQKGGWAQNARSGRLARRCMRASCSQAPKRGCAPHFPQDHMCDPELGDRPSDEKLQDRSCVTTFFIFSSGGKERKKIKKRRPRSV